MFCFVRYQNVVGQVYLQPFTVNIIYYRMFNFRLFSDIIQFRYESKFKYL